MPGKTKVHFIWKHKKLLLFLAILFVVLLIIFWPKKTPPIETQTAKQTNIVASLSATGSVDSTTSVNLNFLAAGKLVYLGVKKGDVVKKGQTIAILDQRTMQKNLESALRDYSKQRNTFDQTKENNQNRTPEGALTDSMARILEDNQYDLDKAVISVELEDLARQQSVLTSPIAGIVTRVDVLATGVNVATTTTFTIADPKQLVFKMDIDEADIGKIRSGQPVTVTLDAYPDKTLDLTVSSIDFATHTTDTGGDAYTVEAALPDNSDLAYRIGMNGDAEIITSKRDDVVTIPLASIQDDKYVYVKTKNGFEKRKVKLGIQNDTDAEATSGVNAGEQIALSPDDAQKLVGSKKKFIFF